MFTLDEGRYGLRLSSVEQVIRLVEITRLPKTPHIVMGVINVRGEVIPVIDIRKRFHLSEPELQLKNQMIIARTSTRKVALVVDAVAGVIEMSNLNTICKEKISSGLEYIEGVLKTSEGLVLIHNLDTFLSLEEDQSLERALADLAEA